MGLQSQLEIGKAGFKPAELLASSEVRNPVLQGCYLQVPPVVCPAFPSTTTQHMFDRLAKFVVYGAQYGSEGKGCVSEYIMKTRQAKWTVIGDAGPNSGHTCSLGKTRNIPAASYFADTIIIGPDACINIDLFRDDLVNVMKVNPNLSSVIIHENAAVVRPGEHERELPWCNDLEQRISSTMTGGGVSRYNKFIARLSDITIKEHTIGNTVHGMPFPVEVIPATEWPRLTKMIMKQDNVLFECSQGLLLDTNFGKYPYVTSRSTSPVVSLERNGFDSRPFTRCATFRTFPIRTGGNSGPTEGKELSWEELGLEPEMATVTKRRRRIFKFTKKELEMAIDITDPDFFFFTHWDYLMKTGMELEFHQMLCDQFNGWHHIGGYFRSYIPAQFNFMPL